MYSRFPARNNLLFFVLNTSSYPAMWFTGVSVQPFSFSFSATPQLDGWIADRDRPELRLACAYSTATRPLRFSGFGDSFDFVVFVPRTTRYDRGSTTYPRIRHRVTKFACDLVNNINVLWDVINFLETS